MEGVWFEWIVVCGKQDYCLTPNQYDHLIKNQDKRLVIFDGFVINPAYVSSMYKQPVKRLKQMFPCGKCGISGYATHSEEVADATGEKKLTYIQEVCGNCQGCGVDLSVPKRVDRELLGDGL